MTSLPGESNRTRFMQTYMQFVGIPAAAQKAFITHETLTPSAQHYFLENKGALPEILHQFYSYRVRDQDDIEYLLDTIMSNPNCSTELLVDIMGTSGLSTDELNVMIDHPNASPALLQLLHNANRRAEWAYSNPALPRDMFMELFIRASAHPADLVFFADYPNLPDGYWEKIKTAAQQSGYGGDLMHSRYLTEAEQRYNFLHGMGVTPYKVASSRHLSRTMQQLILDEVDYRAAGYAPGQDPRKSAMSNPTFPARMKFAYAEELARRDYAHEVLSEKVATAMVGVLGSDDIDTSVVDDCFDWITESSLDLDRAAQKVHLHPCLSVEKLTATEVENVEASAAKVARSDVDMEQKIAALLPQEITIEDFSMTIIAPFQDEFDAFIATQHPGLVDLPLEWQWEALQ